jgi:hypothetical protein
VFWVGYSGSGGNLLVMAWVVSGQKCGSSTQVNSVAYDSLLPHPQGGKYPLWPFRLTQSNTFLVFSFHPGHSFFLVLGQQRAKQEVGQGGVAKDRCF